MTGETGLKYAVVTGSTKGIGRAVAEKLLREGCFVFMNYATDERAAQQAERELAEYAGRFAICRADLSTFEGMESLITFVHEQTNVLDILVLNAGMTDRSAFDEITPESWNCVLNANLTIPVFLIQKLHHLMPAHGRIIIIGSNLGIVPHAMSLAYNISKAGANYLAPSLVKVFAERQITVNAIAPGFVDTPWQSGKPAEIRQNIENKVALHRFAQAGEIAELCWQVVCNEYINGSVLPIHGGYDYK